MMTKSKHTTSGNMNENEIYALTTQKWYAENLIFIHEFNGKCVYGPGKILQENNAVLTCTHIHTIFLFCFVFLSYNPRMMVWCELISVRSLLVYRNNYRKRTLCNYSESLCVNRVEPSCTDPRRPENSIGTFMYVWIEQYWIFEMCVRGTLTMIKSKLYFEH